MVPRTINQQARIIGLPLDEFLPAALLGGGFFFAGKVLLSLFVPLIFVLALKRAKAGKGTAHLLCAGYWNLPKCLMGPLMRSAPPAALRKIL